MISTDVHHAETTPARARLLNRLQKSPQCLLGPVDVDTCLPSQIHVTAIGVVVWFTDTRQRQNAGLAK